MQPLPNLVEDNVFFPVLQRLQECLCAELAKANGPALCYCGMMVGDIMPLDLMNCATGNCGVAWVRPVVVFASSDFPAPDEASSCVATLAMSLEIGVARCYPMANSRQSLDPQAMFEAQRLYLSDMQAIRRAVKCCLADRSYQGSHVMGEWSPIPADGGVSGGFWTLSIRPEA